MLLYVLLLMICHLSLFKVSGKGGLINNDSPDMVFLQMIDAAGPIHFNHVVRRVEETLNLTCKIITHNENYKFKLIWHTPINSSNSKNRFVYDDKTNSSNLVIQHLQENDSGDYKCEAVDKEKILLQSVSVSVKSTKKCGDRFFTCPFGNCILHRFVCDGHRDCKNGEDEAEAYCGPYPCNGKLTCEGRCIPMSWCCQPYNDLNCTVKMRPSCCQQISKSYLENDPGYVSDQQRFSDINFLQTTIYTVIGCALAFMLIVTILVIAICRVRMKRSLLTSRYPPATSAIGAGFSCVPTSLRNRLQPEEHIALYDLDLYLNRSPGLLLTYNINNGVQFVGRPVDPPPYCEVVASPPREGPPPPYVSREDLENEALLHKNSDVTGFLHLTDVKSSWTNNI
ncbi:uncharacterized protein LOC142323442 isoform X2 [Lycorma delicatula]|uniref:uncharacterized protein LOC142323442 isoform X2 n=1 Tax=Lycorma delicatula TaxID=130591 RepID=UPI003F515391